MLGGERGRVLRGTKRDGKGFISLLSMVCSLNVMNCLCLGFSISIFRLLVTETSESKVANKKEPLCFLFIHTVFRPECFLVPLVTFPLAPRVT